MTVKPTTRAPHFGNKSSESRSTSPGMISFIVTNMNVPEGKAEHVISNFRALIIRADIDHMENEWCHSMTT